MPAPFAVAPFECDATPDIGHPIAYGTVEGVDDPLSCRGVVLYPDGLPIVLATIDWIGLYHNGYDLFRTALADAAGTSPERVAIHTIHQHEAPGFDATTETMLYGHGIESFRVDPRFARETIRAAADAVRAANSSPCTHVGAGVAAVDRVASNRQVLGPDGTCCYVRYTSGGSDFEFAQRAPEGVIDPELVAVGFWNHEEPIAALTYYATHPQSYYRNGLVTCDFPGIARNRRESETGVPHIHFTGAAANVTAGKYNDGSEELRPILADRVATGMRTAWENANPRPINASDVAWTVERVGLPPSADLDRAELVDGIAEESPGPPARGLAWLRRCDLGHRIPITGLHLSGVTVLHLPGEPFVEYQLAARALDDTQTIAVAGYGDGGPGYLPTRAAFPMGGYEVDVAKVDPAVESMLQRAIERIVGESMGDRTPSAITNSKPRVDQ